MNEVEKVYFSHTGLPRLRPYWFDGLSRRLSIQRSNTANSRPSPPPQYALTASYSIEPDCPPTLGVVEAVVDITAPVGGQTSLNLYEHVNPDALEDILAASSTKKSDVEVRFTIEEYLVVVRSTKTIRIYEPLEA